MFTDLSIFLFMSTVHSRCLIQLWDMLVHSFIYFLSYLKLYGSQIIYLKPACDPKPPTYFSLL